jgi:hypothetical protein
MDSQEMYMLFKEYRIDKVIRNIAVTESGVYFKELVNIQPGVEENV